MNISKYWKVEKKERIPSVRIKAESRTLLKGTIYRRDGGNWSSMKSGTTEWLLGIWGTSADDIFIVGSNGLVLHGDGSGWSAMSSGIVAELDGVWGSSGTDVFVVGEATLSCVTTEASGRSWPLKSPPSSTKSGAHRPPISLPWVTTALSFTTTEPPGRRWPARLDSLLAWLPFEHRAHWKMILWYAAAGLLWMLLESHPL